MIFLIFIFSLVSASSSNCTTCLNNECCQGGDFCCQKGNICCNGGKGVEGVCCDGKLQTCCADYVHGGICCEKETTFCCPPSGQYASRCCPRWNVCCDSGLSGCCDPGSGFSAENTGYALFVIPDWSDNTPLVSLTLDVTTGNRVDKSTNFNDFGESTRLFVFSPVTNLFYLLQTNWTAAPYLMTLWTIDPVAASVSSALVRGVPSNVTVTGFEVLSNGDLIFATYSDWTKKGYSFFRMNPNNPIATKISQIYFGNNDNYAGWFDEVSDDGKIVYRVGYKDPTTQSIPGLSTTLLTSPNASYTFSSNVPIPSDLSFYISLNLHPIQSNTFVSLAPEPGLLAGDMYLVSWSLGGDSQTLTYWDNANLTPFFGPLAEYVTSSTYYALVVHNNYLDDNFDRWALVSYNFNSQESNYLDLSPLTMAMTDSVSGFGIPN